MSYFIDNSLALNLVGAPNTGFRPGQLGALHSSLAHFSVYDEPAILSLPTGYGKTALLMALPFLLRSVRVLVVEPSDALRRQTTAHFKELSVLRWLRVIDDATPNPKVHGQKGVPAGADEWSKLAEQDIVISTPQSLSPVVAPPAMPDLFDLIIFDEAHHAPAETWATFLEHYPDAKFVFLTATPFRRDRKAIPGRMAYYYPVSKAAKESAFGRVTFTQAPVRNENDDEEIDRSVAQTAVARLRTDQENGFDHRIFARAATIASARKLVEIYADFGARVRSIDSHASKRAQDAAEAELLAGEIDGVVCVDMFGEGYDFPKLKIAALHAPHRSLVPTLQFIGRFARTNDAATGDATLVAPLSRLKEASLKLFKEGIDVSDLIDEVARAQIADAEADREVLDLLKIRKQADSDYDSVTPLLLELYAHAQIFECHAQPDFSRFGDTIARNLRVAKQWSSEDGRISLLLTVDTSPPSWATSDVLVNVRHDAFLLAYNDASHLCFIGSTRRTARIYQDLIQTALPDQHRPISYEQTRRALSGLNSLKFYNVGLRNTAVNSQAESYRVMTGPAAERAITSGDARAYSQGHFFGSGVGDGDIRETIGASSSSRIWSNQRLTVAEYIEWITELNGRLGGGGGISVSQLDIIQHARTLRELPERIIAAGWHKQTYRLTPRIRWRNQAGEPWFYGNITDLDLTNWQVNGTRSAITFDIVSDTFNESFRFRIDGGALFTKIGAKDVEIHTGYDEWSELASWLSEHPPVFYAADKSSFVGVNLIVAATAVVNQLRDDDADALDWDGCKIDLEFGPDQPDGRLSVHRWLERYLMAVPNTVALVYDHRSGEAADYIAVVRIPDGTVAVRLYHCKGAGGAPSGGRVNDVYEVSGQMLKSISYCDAAVLVQHIGHRMNPGRHRNPSQFAMGDFQTLKQTLEEAPPTGLIFEVFGVQPGISKGAVDAHLADLMVYGLDYAQRGGASRAQWLVSA